MTDLCVYLITLPVSHLMYFLLPKSQDTGA